MRLISSLLLHCAGLVLFWLSPFEFGALANLGAWEVSIMEMINELEQDSIAKDLNILDGHLMHLMKNAQEIPMPNVMKQLCQRLTTALLRLMEYSKQLQNRTDFFGLVANDEYFDCLIAKMRSIILGLKTEFVTLIVEIALVDIEKQQWSGEKVPNLVQKFDKLFILISKNVTYCAKAPFQSAKERLTELRGLGDKLEEHQIRQTIEETIVEAKLSILEKEIAAKIPAFANHPIDGDAFILFSRKFHDECLNAHQKIENWPKSVKENVQEKIKELANTARRMSGPLREEIAQKLDAMMDNCKKALEKVKGKLPAGQSEENLSEYRKKKLTIGKVNEIYANLSMQMQILGIIPRKAIHKNAASASAESELFNFGAIQQLIEKQKEEILQAF